MHGLLLSLLLILPRQPSVRRRLPPPVSKGVQEKPFLAATRAQAMRGGAKAQFDLGVMYAFGQGVPKNDLEAVKWYRKAAEQGYAKAQYNLGVCSDFGRGLPKDNAEAVRWYRKAAGQGHAKAEFNLGVSYKYGQGVTRDAAEAYAWFSLAATGGEKKALASREEVALELSPQDLERALARARELQEGIQAAKPKPRRSAGHFLRKSKRKRSAH